MRLSIAMQRNPSESCQRLLAIGGVDLLTIAGHKIGGPRGIGALYVKRGTQMFTNAFGGGQERGLHGRALSRCFWLRDLPLLQKGL